MANQDQSRDYDLLDRLVDEFNDRFRRGERPSVHEYCTKYPELAADLRDLLPAVAQVEGAKDIRAEDAAAAPPPPPPPPVASMGDFHILREVGHGGMGVVYEAEQGSLGRRVALKVLTQRLLRDDKQRRRFEREAKAAARLHHTNIVPVHGYGEHDGSPYYVMQFIHGMGLDVVVEELARIAPTGTHRPNTTPAGGRPPAVSAVARSLLTGAFVPADPHPEPADEVDADATRTQVVAAAGLAAPPALTVAHSSDPSGVSSSAATSSVTLPGQSVTTAGGKTRKLTYWQSVARVGAQVADALSYAHGQGVIHRDIKPSNLLLDLNGTVWVTDFGLAKADGAENLTHTGDVLGTLRYMPPEAFDGRSDARGDVYSLGLTLYELAALRPAFDERDRHRLIKQVTTQTPEPVGRTRKGVPRDLETVIGKAIDRDPARRYQTAAELRDDLQRFVDDEPIRARRQSQWESARRWCRHHPTVAALVGCIFVLLTAISVFSAVAAARFDRLARDEAQAADDANKARQTAETAKTEAEAAERRAVAGKEAAEKARGEADASYRRARKAVDESFTKISESDLLKVPGLQPLRAELLKSAVGFYGDFLKERADDPSLKLDQAAIHVKMARVFADLADEKQARAALDAAIRAYTDAGGGPPDHPATVGLADAWAAYGELYFLLSQNSADRAGHRAESLRGYSKAAALGEVLAAARPADLDAKTALAKALNGVGLSETTPAAVVAAYRRCLELREELLAARPDDPQLIHAVGESLNNIASQMTAGKADRRAEQLALYLLANEYNERAFRLRPSSLEYGLDLSIGYQNAARGHAQAGDGPARLAVLKKDAAHLDGLARANPFAGDLERRRFAAYQTLANAQRAADPEAAAATMRAFIDSLPRPSGGTPDELYFAATARAVLRRYPEFSAADRDRLADLTAEGLRAAVEAGFADSDLVRRDPNLKTLLERDDMVALLARIEGNAKSGGAAARDHRPAMAAGHLTLARIQSDQGNPAAARESVGKAVALRQAMAALKPNDPAAAADLADARLSAGDLAWPAGRPAEAVTEWRAAADGLPAGVNERAARLLTQVGHRFSDRALWADAAGYYVRAVAAGAGPPTLEMAGRCYSAAGDAASFRRLYLAARGKYLDGSDPAGAAALVELAGLDPDADPDPAALVGLGERVAVGKHLGWQLIVGWFETAAGRDAAAARRLADPKFGDGLYTNGWGPSTLAVAHHRLGHREEALRQLARMQQQYAQAMRAYDADPAGDPLTGWGPRVGVAAAYRRAARIVTGEVMPPDPRERLYRGRVYALLGEPTKAEAEFAAAVAARPADPEVYLLRAKAYEAAGQVEKVAADRAKAKAAADALLAGPPVTDPTLAGGLAAYLADADGLFAAAAAGWSVLDPAAVASKTGAPLAIKVDRSVLAGEPSGEFLSAQPERPASPRRPVPTTEVYTVTADLPPGPVTALRLEALPDPSLPTGGSGRHPLNGGFGVSALTVVVDGRPVRLATAAADRAWNGAGAEAAIDGRVDTVWSPYPDHHDRRVLVVGFDRPVTGNQIVVGVECRGVNWAQYVLGRFRLAVTADPAAPGRVRAAAVITDPAASPWLRLAVARPGPAAAGYVARALAEEPTAGDRAARELAARSDELFDEVVKSRPADAGLWLARGRHLRDRGDRAGADAAFLRAATLAPDELERFLEGGWVAAGPFAGEMSVRGAPEDDPDPFAPPAAGKPAWVPVPPVGRADVWVAVSDAVTLGNGAGAYTAADLYSPDDRATAFTLVYPGPVRVWVNGRLVHAAEAGGGFVWDPGTPLVPISLVKGRNRLLVRTTATADRKGGFHLRLAGDPFERYRQAADAGLWAEAEAALVAALRRVPGDRYLTERHAALLWATGRPAEARAVYDRLAANSSTLTDPHLAMDVLRAAAFFPGTRPGLGRLAALAEAGLGKQHGRVEWVLWDVGVGYLKAGRWDYAIRLLDEWQATRPDQLTAPARALAALGRKDHEAAARHLAEAEAWWARAVADRMAGTGVGLPSSSERVLTFLALLDEARAALGVETAPAPGFVALQNQNRRRLAALDPATAPFDRAVLRSWWEARPYTARAVRRAELGREAESAADFAEAVRRQPNDPETWLARGRAYDDLKRYGAAAADFARALDLLPTDEGYHSDRTKALRLLVQRPEAFAKLIALRPKDTHLVGVRGQWHLLNSRWAEAAADYKRVAKLRPPSDETTEAAAAYLLAGDRPAYDDLCRWLLAQAGGTGDPALAFVAARAAGLADPPAVPAADLLRLADRLTGSPDPPAWFVHAAGTARLRAGGAVRAVARAAVGERRGGPQPARSGPGPGAGRPAGPGPGGPGRGRPADRAGVRGGLGRVPRPAAGGGAAAGCPVVWGE